MIFINAPSFHRFRLTLDRSLRTRDIFVIGRWTVPLLMDFLLFYPFYFLLFPYSSIHIVAWNHRNKFRAQFGPQLLEIRKFIFRLSGKYLHSPWCRINELPALYVVGSFAAGKLHFVAYGTVHGANCRIWLEKPLCSVGLISMYNVTCKTVSKWNVWHKDGKIECSLRYKVALGVNSSNSTKGRNQRCLHNRIATISEIYKSKITNYMQRER